MTRPLPFPEDTEPTQERLRSWFYAASDEGDGIARQDMECIK